MQRRERCGRVTSIDASLAKSTLVVIYLVPLKNICQNMWQGKSFIVTCSIATISTSLKAILEGIIHPGVMFEH